MSISASSSFGFSCADDDLLRSWPVTSSSCWLTKDASSEAVRNVVEAQKRPSSSFLLTVLPPLLSDRNVPMGQSLCRTESTTHRCTTPAHRPLLVAHLVCVCVALREAFPGLLSSYFAALTPSRRVLACRITSITNPATAAGSSDGQRFVVSAQIDYSSASATATGTGTSSAVQSADFQFDVQQTAPLTAAAATSSSQPTATDGQAHVAWHITDFRLDLTALTYPCSVCAGPAPQVPRDFTDAKSAAAAVDVHGAWGFDFAFHRKRQACVHEFVAVAHPTATGQKTAQQCKRCEFQPSDVRCAAHPRHTPRDAMTK
jgi:hypothetical protein